LRVLTAEPVGDGESDGRLSCLRTVRLRGPADDRPGDESSTDDRDPARLPVQRDGHRGSRVSGGLQRLNVHKSYTKPIQGGRAMGVLKRKEEPSETITLRVPASVKAEIDQLRERTNEAG